MLKVRRGFNFRPYVIATVGIALATAITVLWGRLNQIHSMAVYMVAVVLIASFNGLYPSLWGIFLSSVSFAYFIAPPQGLSIGSWEDKVRLISFVLITVLFSLLHNARITTEQKLRSMVQRLQLALEGTKLGVWDLSLDTGAVWHSASMEEIFARHGERFSQAYEVFIGYVHPEDRGFVHCTVTHAIEHGEEFHIQYRILLPDSEMRWVTTRGRVFFDSKGQAERLVAATEDMTDRPGTAIAPAAKLNAIHPTAEPDGLEARAG